MYVIPNPGATPDTTGCATLALYLKSLFDEGYRSVSGSVANFPDIPSMGWGYGIETFAGNGGWLWDVELFRATSPDRWFRQWQSNGDWLFDWQHYPTATKPQELPLPLEAGVQGNPGYKAWYSKDQESKVLIVCNALNNGFFLNEGVIATMPPGYRCGLDNEKKSATVTTINGVMHPAKVVIEASTGQIKLFFNSGVTNVHQVDFEASYIAAQ